MDVLLDSSLTGAARLAAAAHAVAQQAAARAPDLDDDGAFPDEDVVALHRAGLLAAPLPPAHGGAGLGTCAQSAGAAFEVLRLIGWGSLPLGRLYEGHVNALRLVVRHGNAAQVARLAAEARAGGLFGVWNTDDGMDGLALRREGARHVLQGRKILASGAGFVSRPVLTARWADGAIVMVVPQLTPGARADLSDWHPLGMRASATGAVDFSAIEVTPDDILGEAGDYHRQPAFSGGAWRFAAVQLGGIERLFEEMRSHLQARGRTGDPHQRVRAGEAAIAVETARMWVERAAVMAEGEHLDAERIVAFVNLARTAVERAGLDVLERVQRSVGLAGFMRGHPVERLSRDLATYLRQPAPDRALTEAGAYVLERAEQLAQLWPAP